MTTARSLLRLAFAGLFVNMLAVACVTSSDDDDDTMACNPGDSKECVCDDETVSTRKCNADGNGYAQCACKSTNTGGTSGNGGNGGEGNVATTAGTTSTYAGENAGGSGGDNTGPVTGGAGGDDGMAGAGGNGPELPLECQDPKDNCEICYYGGCCEQWAPCLNDTTCVDEFTSIQACTDEIRTERNVLTADLESCAQEVGSASGSWSSDISPLTVDLINCMAGEAGWEGKPWGALSCKEACFDKQ
jgi:hypothetical protein